MLPVRFRAQSLGSTLIIIGSIIEMITLRPFLERSFLAPVDPEYDAVWQICNHL